jgi:hypothetical protein
VDLDDHGFYCDLTIGKCTLQPKHVEVHKDHWCGQYVEKIERCWHTHKNIPKSLSTRQYKDNIYESYSNTYDKLTEARKEIKELRRMYKDKVGKSAVIKKNKKLGV